MDRPGRYRWGTHHHLWEHFKRVKQARALDELTTRDRRGRERRVRGRCLTVDQAMSQGLTPPGAVRLGPGDVCICVNRKFARPVVCLKVKWYDEDGEEHDYDEPEAEIEEYDPDALNAELIDGFELIVRSQFETMELEDQEAVRRVLGVGPRTDLPGRLAACLEKVKPWLVAPGCAILSKPEEACVIVLARAGAAFDHPMLDDLAIKQIECQVFPPPPAVAEAARAATFTTEEIEAAAEPVLEFIALPATVDLGCFPGEGGVPHCFLPLMPPGRYFRMPDGSLAREPL